MAWAPKVRQSRKHPEIQRDINRLEITQGELAELSGIPQEHISKIISGQYATVPEEKVQKLKEVLAKLIAAAYAQREISSK